MKRSALGRRLFVGVLCAGLATSVWAQDSDEEGRRKSPKKSQDLCEVADDNLSRAAQAILRDENRRPAFPTTKRWDKRTSPKHLDQVERRFALRPSERELLYKNGFVVVERVNFPSFGHALHEMYQSELPLFVSLDALLYAVYASNDNLIADVEDALLAPTLARVLSSLRRKLPTFASELLPETQHDLEVYLRVAEKLLKTGPKTGSIAAENEADAMVQTLLKKNGLVEVSLFGRPRIVDVSQYTPRGHYAGKPEREALFQTVMWLSRLELNLVSRSSRSSAPGNVPDKRETAREARLAWALASLCEHSGVLDDLATLEKLWTVLAGRREDVSVQDLLTLAKTAQLTQLKDLRDPQAVEKLQHAIGSGFARTVPLHYMPPGTKELPVIATLLGPRIVADAQALKPVVHDETPEKYGVAFAEVAFGLGHDRALQYLSSELKKHPGLRGKLNASRSLFAWQGPKGMQTDLYATWFAALRGLSSPLRGTTPSFMGTEAYTDFRLNSAAAGYAQIKHNYVLSVGQPYFFGGCEIPDGFVEPNSDVIRSLREYARRGELAFHDLDAKNTWKALSYFRDLGKQLDVLSVIVEDELEGKPLSAEEKRYLSMVVEMRPGTTGEPPTYTGWYFDLLRRRSSEGLSSAKLIADYYTSTELQEVSYVGTNDVVLGLFVVDTGGPPRVVAGPVLAAYETHHSLQATPSRLSDETAAQLPSQSRLAPWSQSYTAKAPTEVPDLSLTFDPDASLDIMLETPKPLTAVTVSLLDHHRQPIASQHRSFPKGKTVFRFPTRNKKRQVIIAKQIAGISVKKGEFFVWAEIERSKPESGIHIDTRKSPQKP
ncbi:MAG TPA: DUF3160 domain-containing protein [Pseudomonadota bacterium]|nr:DUF3160 domain-containing protein [Pseudomonadota bacterium]